MMKCFLTGSDRKSHNNNRLKKYLTIDVNTFSCYNLCLLYTGRTNRKKYKALIKAISRHHNIGVEEVATYFAWIQPHLSHYQFTDSSIRQKKLVAYTDGACTGNPGPGGYGSHFKYMGEHKELSGGDSNTTNNRMEMTAVLKTLQFALKKKIDNVVIYTDSKYTLDGCTTWIHRPGWISSHKNSDIWNKILRVYNRLNVKMKWVKGHSNDPGNELADRIATNQAKRFA